MEICEQFLKRNVLFTFCVRVYFPLNSKILSIFLNNRNIYFDYVIPLVTDNGRNYVEIVALQNSKNICKVTTYKEGGGILFRRHCSLYGLL